MTEDERSVFNFLLDRLAITSGVEKFNEELKDEYWKVLQTHTMKGFKDGIEHLEANFRPRWKNHFPAPVEINDAIEIVLRISKSKSRSYDEIKRSYEKRELVIGDEAKHRLEDEILANFEANSGGERVGNREHFFNGRKGSPDPSKLRLKDQVQTETANTNKPEVERLTIALNGLALGYGRHLEAKELETYLLLLKTYSLQELLDACWYFWGEKGRRYFTVIDEFHETLKK